MRLARLIANGFRNLAGQVAFSGPLTLLAGENNTGKSNIIDALRLIAQPHAGARFNRWITSDDFAHDGRGNRLRDSFEIEAVLLDLSDSERARMVTCLAPSLGDRAARLRMHAQLAETGRVNVVWYGGDSLQPAVEAWARAAIVHTYMHPLRDAAADLRPGRENRLVQLLSALAPKNSLERMQIEKTADQANKELAAVKAVSKAKGEVQERLNKMAGPVFAQQSDLVFADPRFERVVGTLRALVGDQSPLELAENGLGFNNLLYMATLLAAIDNEPEEGLHLLLVEEPEAHLHPQLQDLLMRYLEREAGGQTQVIVTTHSPNFASASGVERMTVLARLSGGGSVVARAPAEFGMPQTSLDHLRRFLDVTKASLLFARGVILVEGIAEQLVLPLIGRQIGLSLSEAGIAVVNVGGLSFAPFAQLFAPDRLPYRCAIVSDGDPPSREAEEQDLDDGEAALSATARKLKAQETPTMHVFLSQRTFEWDLAQVGNWDLLLEALRLVKPRVAARLATEQAEATNEARADALLKAVDGIKGRFAQALTQLIEGRNDMVVPSYLRQAIEWVVGQVPTAPDPVLGQSS